MSKAIGSISLAWLVVAVAIISSCVAQPNPAVVDVTGQALLPGVEYYILPQVNTGAGGGLTLVDRNDSCPLYVGQDTNAGSEGYPVIFTPFFAQDTVIAENRDFRIVFSAASICVQSTAWQLNTATEGRRLIVTGGGEEGFGGYFKIDKNARDEYSMVWCPTDACPTCRFRCGTAGVFVENGKRLLALDGPEPEPEVLNVVFRRL